MKLMIKLIFGTLFLPLFSLAQSDQTFHGSHWNLNKFHVSASYGITKIYGDINKNTDLGSVGIFQLDYQLIRGFYIGLVTQYGVLKSEKYYDYDPRTSKNDYLSAGIVATAHPYQLFTKINNINKDNWDDVLESLFIGVGSSYVFNKYDYIYRNVDIPMSYGPTESFDEDNNRVFKNKSSTLILPSLQIGSVYPLYKRSLSNRNSLGLILKAEFDFGSNDYLDGYKPYHNENNPIESSNDMFTIYSLGFRYSF